MFLAECQHHSAPRQRKARAQEEEREVHHKGAFRTTVPWRGAAQLAVGAAGPQEPVQLHTAVHTADVSPFVQILDVPVPQMGDQLVDFMKMHDTLIPEQVIAVPKISCPPRPLRAFLSEPQMTEQLVEVPTELSFFSQVVDQNADIPVLGARGVPGHGGLQGFLPEQSSHPSDEQTVDIPVPGRGVRAGEVFKVFTQDKVCSALLSRSLPFLFPVEVLKIFSLILVRQLLPRLRVKSWGKVFFGPFLRKVGR